MKAHPDLKEDENIYVFGGLSDWHIKERFKLTYYPEEKVYYTKVLLKQGYYDYKYAVSENPGSRMIDTRRLEGSHYETENDYIIFIYFRSPFLNTYKLVGYKQLNTGVEGNQ